MYFFNFSGCETLLINPFQPLARILSRVHNSGSLLAAVSGVRQFHLFADSVHVDRGVRVRRRQFGRLLAKVEVLRVGGHLGESLGLVGFHFQFVRSGASSEVEVLLAAKELVLTADSVLALLGRWALHIYYP